MKAQSIIQEAAVIAAGWSVSATVGVILDDPLGVKPFENVPNISGGVGLGEGDAGPTTYGSVSLWRRGNCLAGAEVTTNWRFVCGAH
jgi:hypothetical protein